MLHVITSVVNVTFLFYYMCRIANDTMETLDTYYRTCWKDKPHHLTYETKCFSMITSLLDNFLEYQCSPAHIQREIALSVYLAGNVVELSFPL
jgi:hypothetical protein